MLERVEDEQSDSRRQTAAAAVVDLGDQVGNRCAAKLGNSCEFFPEPVLERQAGAVPPDADRSLFHMVLFDMLFRSAAHKPGDDFNMAAEAELVNHLQAGQPIAAGDKDRGVARETGRIA